MTDPCITAYQSPEYGAIPSQTTCDGYEHTYNFFLGGGVSLLRVIFRVFVKQAHIRVSFDFRINGHLRSSLFWDVTQRKLVATDISENLLVPP